MTADERRRRVRAMRAWRRFNPLASRLAGIAPWWVLLETTGRQRQAAPAAVSDEAARASS